jgi:hypothetical protein
MANLPILKAKVDEAKCVSDTFNDFPVKALNQQTIAFFTLKALGCLLIALMTLYLYIMLRWYTIPNVYWHDCTANDKIHNNLQNNSSHVIL